MPFENRTHKKITKKDKIAACFGFLTLKSTAKVCGSSNAWVSKVWASKGFEYKKIVCRYNEFY
jgi:hypothetical protein